MIDEAELIGNPEAEARPEKLKGGLRRRRPAAWVTYLSVALPLLAVYRFLPNQVANSIVYDAVALSCLLAILVGVRIHRPTNRLPWYLLATAVAVWLGGDLVWTYFERVEGIAPFPSIADAMYLSAYPFFASGVYLLVRRHSPKGDRSIVLDAAIITIGVGVLAWMFLMDPYAHDQNLTAMEKIVSMAYPAGDLLVISVLVRVILGSGARSVAFILIGSGLALSIASDSVYGLMLIEGTYYTGHLVDFGWLLFYVLWGTAALHPSMAALARQAPEPRGIATGWRLLLMAAAAILAPVVVLVQPADAYRSHVTGITFASIIMFLLVILRMGGLLGRLESALTTVRRVQREKEKLLDRTMQIAEEERRRIAIDLHDGPVQKLSALAYRFEVGLLQLQDGDQERAVATLTDVRDSFGTEIDALRKVMSGLRPPALDERGLETALRDQLAAFRESSQIHGTFSVGLQGRLPRDVETGLFRVTQEALINVAKHSRARNVRVDLQGDGDWARLTVDDDGVGFDTADLSNRVDGRFGLIAMRQRMEMLGGGFEVRSSPLTGTVVTARFGEPPP